MQVAPAAPRLPPSTESVRSTPPATSAHRFTGHRGQPGGGRRHDVRRQHHDHARHSGWAANGRSARSSIGIAADQAELLGHLRRPAVCPAPRPRPRHRHHAASAPASSSTWSSPHDLDAGQAAAGSGRARPPGVNPRRASLDEAPLHAAHRPDLAAEADLAEEERVGRRGRGRARWRAVPPRRRGPPRVRGGARPP